MVYTRVVWILHTNYLLGIITASDKRVFIENYLEASRLYSTRRHTSRDCYGSELYSVSYSIIQLYLSRIMTPDLIYLVRLYKGNLQINFILQIYTTVHYIVRIIYDESFFIEFSSLSSVPNNDNTLIS